MLSEGRLEYDSTVGATARFQRDYNGKQPGDPKKAAEAIVRLTQEQNPPLRLLLGSDTYNGAEKNDLARLEEARRWKELSLSTISSFVCIFGEIKWDCSKSSTIVAKPIRLSRRNLFACDIVFRLEGGPRVTKLLQGAFLEGPGWEAVYNALKKSE